MTVSNLRDFFNSIMEDNDWTQADLARAAGVSSKNVSEWMAGKASPSPAKLATMAENLRVDLNHLRALTGLAPVIQAFSLPPERRSDADTLTRSQRAVIFETIRLFAEGNRRAGDEGADSTPAIAADENKRHLYAVPEKIPAFIAEERGVDGIGMDDLPEDP